MSSNSNTDSFRGAQEIKNKLVSINEVDVLGPVDSPIFRIKKKYRTRLLIVIIIGGGPGGYVCAIRVTFEPNLFQTLESSKPIYPPPITQRAITISARLIGDYTLSEALIFLEQVN